jgi:hypothetical protein
MITDPAIAVLGQVLEFGDDRKHIWEKAEGWITQRGLEGLR